MSTCVSSQGPPTTKVITLHSMASKQNEYWGAEPESPEYGLCKVLVIDMYFLT